MLNSRNKSFRYNNNRCALFKESNKGLVSLIISDILKTKIYYLIQSLMNISKNIEKNI